MQNSINFVEERIGGGGENQNLSQEERRAQEQTIWIKPPPHTLKRNVDATIFLEQTAMGVGMIQRDHIMALL